MHHFQNNLERVRLKGFDCLQSYTSFNNKKYHNQGQNQICLVPSLISSKMHNDFRKRLLPQFSSDSNIQTVLLIYFNLFKPQEFKAAFYVHVKLSCVHICFADRNTMVPSKKGGEQRRQQIFSRGRSSKSLYQLAPWLTIVIIWDCTVEQMW